MFVKNESALMHRPNGYNSTQDARNPNPSFILNAYTGAPEIKNTKYATSTQYRIFLYFFFSCTKCATSTQNGVIRSTIHIVF